MFFSSSISTVINCSCSSCCGVWTWYPHLFDKGVENCIKAERLLSGVENCIKAECLLSY